MLGGAHYWQIGHLAECKSILSGGRSLREAEPEADLLREADDRSGWRLAPEVMSTVERVLEPLPVNHEGNLLSAALAAASVYHAP